MKKMNWFKDIHGRQIRFTEERLNHIKINHPEMFENIDTTKRGVILLGKEIKVWFDKEGDYIEVLFKQKMG